MSRKGTQRLPEGVEVVVLDSSANLREDAAQGNLTGYLSDNRALVGCDISNQDGGQDGPYGRLLSVKQSSTP